MHACRASSKRFSNLLVSLMCFFSRKIIAVLDDGKQKKKKKVELLCIWRLCSKKVFFFIYCTV